MRRNHTRTHVLLGVCLAGVAPCIALAEDPGVKKDDAWRTDIGAFGKEVLAVAKESKVPDDFQLLRSIRSRATFQNKKGENILVILKYGFEKELHGELAKRFTGTVTWQAPVKSTEIDEKNKCHVIEVEFPVPNDVPKYLKFRDGVRLEIPFTTLPRDKAPAKGLQFSFTGDLKKEKKDDLFDPVWVLYGVGPESGNHLVGVSLINVTPGGKTK